MGALVKTLHHDFTPDADERERVTIWIDRKSVV